jgi:hypothetical protein
VKSNYNNCLFEFKLNPTQDGMFRRILGVAKDVGLIEKTLSDTETEFSFMETVIYKTI